MLTVILMSNKLLDCLEKIKRKLYSIQRPFLIFATVFNPPWLAGSTDTGGQLDLTGPFSSFLNDSIELRVHSYFFTGALQTSWNTYLRPSLLSSRAEQTRNKCRDMGTKVKKVRVRGQRLTVRGCAERKPSAGLIAYTGFIKLLLWSSHTLPQQSRACHSLEIKPGNLEHHGSAELS